MANSTCRGRKSTSLIGWENSRFRTIRHAGNKPQGSGSVALWEVECVVCGAQRVARTDALRADQVRCHNCHEQNQRAIRCLDEARKSIKAGDTRLALDQAQRLVRMLELRLRDGE